MPAIAIVGPSGSGKTTSIAPSKGLNHIGLNPEETFIISIEKSTLPFGGWKKVYPVCDIKKIETFKTGRFLHSDNIVNIKKVVNFISVNRPEIKNLIIDDGQYLVGNMYFNRANETGFGKFTDMGKLMFDLVRMLNHGLRPDLYAFITMHSETIIDANGTPKTQAKTFGKMFSEKYTFEGVFNTVLFSDSFMDDEKKDADGNPLINKCFVTQSDGITTAKSPYGAFKELRIPNDLGLVRQRLEAFDSGESEEGVAFGD